MELFWEEYLDALLVMEEDPNLTRKLVNIPVLVIGMMLNIKTATKFLRKVILKEILGKLDQKLILRVKILKYLNFGKIY